MATEVVIVGVGSEAEVVMEGETVAGSTGSVAVGDQLKLRGGVLQDRGGVLKGVGIDPVGPV